jgi:hypothetical protein
MDPEELNFYLTSFSVLMGLIGMVTLFKHLSQSKSKALPPRRHPYARS